MLTQTTETAIRVMIFFASTRPTEPVSVRQLGDAVGGSPTYLAKTLRDLVRARLLESFRGTAGGVKLGAAPEDVTLLAIVEAAQGPLIESYCRTAPADYETCPFHRAMLELRSAAIDVLSKWTLAALAEPCAVGPYCKMLLSGFTSEPVSARPNPKSRKGRPL